MKCLNKNLMIIPLFLLTNCSYNKAIIKTDLGSSSLPKIISIYDCTVVSIPDPRILEIEYAKTLNDKTSAACINQLNGLEVVKTIKSVSFALGQNEKLLARTNIGTIIDSIVPQIYENDSIQILNNLTKGIILKLCRRAYPDPKYSLGTYGLSSYLQADSNIAKLQMLKKVTNADYCLINSLYGTLRRQPTSNSEKVITAAATAIMSIAGGLIIVPGDETIFQSQSILINLTSGKLEFSEDYCIGQLYAVEKLDAVKWVNDVFKKLKINSEKALTKT